MLPSEIFPQEFEVIGTEVVDCVIDLLTYRISSIITLMNVVSLIIEVTKDNTRGHICDK